MKLEWDERKNRLNQQKHGIAFSLAARVFADECRLLEEDRIDEETGEQRWHAIGGLAASRYTSSSTFIEEKKMEKKSSGSSRRGTLISVKAEDVFNKPLTKRERETVRRTAERQAAGDDSHIDYSDSPPLTDEQLAAMSRFRDARDRLEKKKMVSLYVRGDVLEWLRSKGPGHLTRINDILTSVMEAERRVRGSA
jgi:uncharacterized DUF497 family protein/uncharacterized protein (DUF4415 family)